MRLGRSRGAARRELVLGALRKLVLAAALGAPALGIGGGAATFASAANAPAAAAPKTPAAPAPAALAAPPDRRALDVAVDALWSALSNEPGRAPDVATLRRLFHPDARVLGVDPRVAGAPLRQIPLVRFLARFEQPSDRGFYEREIRREVEQYGAFAHVLSVVESRFVRDAPRAEYAGINSIQWYWEGSAWRILSLYYHLEDAAAPFPRP